MLFKNSMSSYKEIKITVEKKLNENKIVNTKKKNENKGFKQKFIKKSDYVNSEYRRETRNCVWRLFYVWTFSFLPCLSE